MGSSGDLYFYMRVVREYLRKSRVQLPPGNFEVNGMETIAVLQLPLAGIETKTGANFFNIDISSMARNGIGRIFLTESRDSSSSKVGENEYVFTTNAEFSRNMMLLLPLKSKNEISSGKRLEMKTLVKIIKNYLDDNRITGYSFDIGSENSSLELPLDGIDTGPEELTFCIDLYSTNDAKITILGGSSDPIKEEGFKTESEFSDLVRVMLPLKTKGIKSMHELGYKIDKIERKIDSILEILNKRSG
jgi:hypothetical protein